MESPNPTSPTVNELTHLLVEQLEIRPVQEHSSLSELFNQKLAALLTLPKSALLSQSDQLFYKKVKLLVTRSNTLSSAVLNQLLGGKTGEVAGSPFGPPSPSLFRAAELGNGRTHQIVYSKDGARVAVARSNGYASIRDAQTLAECLQLKEQQDTPVYSVAFSPDGASLLIGCHNDGDKVCLWDLSSGRKIASFAGIIPQQVKFNPTGEDFAAIECSSATTAHSKIQLWDTRTRQPTMHFVQDSIFGCGIAYRSGHRLVSTGHDTVYLWDLRMGGKWTSKLLNSGGPFDISPNEQSLAARSYVTGSYSPGNIDIWDLNTEKKLVSLSGHTRAIRSLEFSPFGNLLASSTNNDSFRLWDIKSSKQVGLIPADYWSGTAVAFHPKGKQLIGDAEGLTVYELFPNKQN